MSNFVACGHDLNCICSAPRQCLGRCRHRVRRRCPRLSLPSGGDASYFLGGCGRRAKKLCGIVTALERFSECLFRLKCVSTCLIPPGRVPGLRPRTPCFFSRSRLFYFFERYSSCCTRDPKPHTHNVMVPTLFQVLCYYNLHPGRTQVLPCEGMRLTRGCVSVLRSGNPGDHQVFVDSRLISCLVLCSERISTVFPRQSCFFPMSVSGTCSMRALYCGFALV